MGNICGKSDSENFTSPGRTVGTAPTTGPKSSSVPAKARVSGPGRTLGGGSGGGSNGPEATTQATEDARSKAAQAAEARAKAANKPGGKLQTQLAAQKRQNRTDTLKEASHQEQQTREADDAAKARNWD